MKEIENSQPVKEARAYSYKNPKGYHDIKILPSQKHPGKYSFSIGFGRGLISKIPGIEKDTPYQFGCFNTPDEAIKAAKFIVTRE